MSTDSPGPDGSRVIEKLTPKSIKTVENLKNNIHSWADTAELEMEISHLNKLAIELNDLELFRSTQEFSKQLDDQVKKLASPKNAEKIKYSYKKEDHGPFWVYVEGKAGNIGNVHPLKLGKMLCENKTFKLRIKTIKKKGRNRVGIEFASAFDANLFVAQAKFEDCEIYIPPTYIISMGVISDIDMCITDENIMKEAKSNYEILNVRRLKRRIFNDKTGKSEYVDSKSCVLTFRSTIIPQYVSLFYNNLEVNQYISTVVQCFNCLMYGHTAKICNGKKRCSRCGEEHMEMDCNTNDPKCIYCKLNHKATDKSCEEYNRQRRIKDMMATHKYTFYEADLILKNKNHINTNTNSLNNADFPELPKRDYIVSSNELPPTVSQTSFAQMASLPRNNIEQKNALGKAQNTNSYNSNKMSPSGSKLSIGNTRPPPANSKSNRFTQLVIKNKPPRSAPGYDKKALEDCYETFIPDYKRNKLTEINKSKDKEISKEEENNAKIYEDKMELVEVSQDQLSQSQISQTQDNNFMVQVSTVAQIHNQKDPT